MQSPFPGKGEWEQGGESGALWELSSQGGAPQMQADVTACPQPGLQGGSTPRLAGAGAVGLIRAPRSSTPAGAGGSVTGEALLSPLR